jgi:hypothetical protein
MACSVLTAENTANGLESKKVNEVTKWPKEKKRNEDAVSTVEIKTEMKMEADDSTLDGGGDTSDVEYVAATSPLPSDDSDIEYVPVGSEVAAVVNREVPDGDDDVVYEAVSGKIDTKGIEAKYLRLARIHQKRKRTEEEDDDVIILD